MDASEIKKLPLFEQCSAADLEQLLRHPHRRQAFPSGALILRQGDPCRSLMALTEGCVECRMGSDEGREVVVERIVAPNLLAPVFLFSENSAVPVEVTAATDAVVHFINREGFADFMRNRPHVMSAFMQELAARGHFLSSKVHTFATKSLQGRVLDYLDSHGSITSVAAAAEMLGVARPSLSRVLAEMQAAGLVVRTKEGIVLK